MEHVRETAGSLLAKLLKAKEEAGLSPTETNSLNQRLGEQIHRQLNPDGQTEVTVSIDASIILPPKDP